MMSLPSFLPMKDRTRAGEARSDETGEMPVAGVAEDPGRQPPIGPDHLVIRLQRRSDAQRGPRNEDMAEFLGPDVIFRHEDEPAEGPDPARRGNAPSGLLEHFSVQGPNGCFPRVD